MEPQKVYDFIKNGLMNLIVVLTSLAYIFYGMVVIKKTDLSVVECVSKVGIGLVVGIAIKQGLGENGFNLGYASKIWVDKLASYSHTCNLANPYIERTDYFYYSEEIEKRRNYRRKSLMNARMRYEWFFDFKGNYIVNDEMYKKLDRHQRKVLRKCINIKIYNLNLFSEYDNELENSTRREKTDKIQRAKMFSKNGLSQVFTAILGAYFVAVWDKWDWGSFIIATLQVFIWISTGVIQLYTNYNYVVIEKVNKLTRKIELIIKFTKGCEKGMYITNPYDDEVVVEDEQKGDIPNKIRVVSN